MSTTINEQIAELTKSPGGRKELRKAAGEAEKRIAAGESKAEQGVADAKASGTMYDGTASDGKGRTVEPRFRPGQDLRIRDNVSGLRDGGMEGCRVTPHGTPYIGDDGEVRQSVKTENGETLGVPERALEQHRAPSRISSSMAGLFRPGQHEAIFGERRPLSHDHCGPRCSGARHSLDDHRESGDPACQKR